MSPQLFSSFVICYDVSLMRQKTLCARNTYFFFFFFLQFGAASELRTIFQSSINSLNSLTQVVFSTDRSAAVPVLQFFFTCVSVVSIMLLYLVDVRSSSLILSLSWEGYSPWLHHLLGKFIFFFFCSGVAIFVRNCILVSRDICLLVSKAWQLPCFCMILIVYIICCCAPGSFSKYSKI